MNKLIYIAASLFLLCSIFTISLFAEGVIIDYIEGVVEKKEGAKWIELFEDDEIDIKSVIRLKNKSMAELSGDDISITLIQPGTYNLKDIIEKSRKTNSYGIDEIVSSKFAALIEDSGDKETEGSVMGVRAANIEEEVDFIGDDIIANIFRTAKKKIAEKDYNKAIALLKDAYDWANEDNENILLYYIGFCYAKLQKEALAFTYLRDVKNKPDMPFYADYVILYGSLLMKSFAYEEALALFLDYIRQVPQVKTLEYQDIYYLSALCYIHLNNTEKTIAYLKKAKDLISDSETGKKAVSLLKEFG